ncbi:MAG: outer membrane lipoprotein-sorting protein [Verrucomicrobiota bacterium]
MICRSAHFRKPHALLALILFPLLARAGPEAAAILEAARVNPLGQKITLTAQLRAGSSTTPFQIIVDGRVRYVFTKPDQELILELQDDASVLTERLGGKAATIRPARYDEPVRSSGLTYEDLSLKFLYWKNPTLIGEETIRTRPSWKIEVQAPRGGASQYGVARLWIDQESGALLRVEGYDRKGQLIRRFEIVSAQKLDGQWMLKQMRIETFDPDTKKTTARAYLEVLGKAQ